MSKGKVEGWPGNLADEIRANAVESDFDYFSEPMMDADELEAKLNEPTGLEAGMSKGKREFDPEGWLANPLIGYVSIEDSYEDGGFTGYICDRKLSEEFFPMIEYSAYEKLRAENEELKAELEDHIEVLNSINSRVDPGTCDSVDAMLEIVKENERLRAENQSLFLRLKRAECKHSFDVYGCCELCGLGGIREALAKGEGE